MNGTKVNDGIFTTRPSTILTDNLLTHVLFKDYILSVIYLDLILRDFSS